VHAELPDVPPGDWFCSVCAAAGGASPATSSQPAGGGAASGASLSRGSGGFSGGFGGAVTPPASAAARAAAALAAAAITAGLAALAVAAAASMATASAEARQQRRRMVQVFLGNLCVIQILLASTCLQICSSPESRPRLQLLCVCRLPEAMLLQPGCCTLPCVALGPTSMFYTSSPSRHNRLGCIQSEAAVAAAQFWTCIFLFVQPSRSPPSHGHVHEPAGNVEDCVPENVCLPFMRADGPVCMPMRQALLSCNCRRVVRARSSCRRGSPTGASRRTTMTTCAASVRGCSPPCAARMQAPVCQAAALLRAMLRC